VWSDERRVDAAAVLLLGVAAAPHFLSAVSRCLLMPLGFGVARRPLAPRRTFSHSFMFFEHYRNRGGCVLSRCVSHDGPLLRFPLRLWCCRKVVADSEPGPGSYGAAAGIGEQSLSV
jgi:hypothetical protein